MNPRMLCALTAGLALPLVVSPASVTADGRPSAASPTGARTSISVGRPEQVAPLRDGRMLSLTVVTDRDGVATAVWRPRTGPIQAARRSPAGDWRTESLGVGRWPEVGVDGRGRVTVVWERFYRREVVTRRWARHGWGPLEVLVPWAGDQRRVYGPWVAVNARGRSMMIWGWTRKYVIFDRATAGRGGSARLPRGFRAVHRSPDGSWGGPERVPTSWPLGIFVSHEGTPLVLRREGARLVILRRSPRHGWIRGPSVAFQGGVEDVFRNKAGDLAVSQVSDSDPDYRLRAAR